MKKTGIKIAVTALLLWACVVTATAEGKNLKDDFSLSEVAQVNGVKIKPGRYEARFNAEKNEVVISDRARVIATVKVSVRRGEGKAGQTQIYTARTDKGLMLSKLVFKGDDREIVLDESAIAGN
jgi:hypothetical protein